MCVAPDRAAFFARSAFLGVLAGAAAPLAGGLTGIEVAAAADQAPTVGLPEPTGHLSRGNATAAALARRSPLAHATYARVEALANAIGDPDLKRSALDLIRGGKPAYALRYPSSQSRVAVRDALAREGYVAADAPVRGIFPPDTEPEQIAVPQPFWSAPGSSNGSHHAYPGGLAMHESFNATVAQGFATSYDQHYFGGRPNVSRDVVVAAALHHDVMKTVVFAWKDDGTLLDELAIAGTGGHHVLSGAEAIARGLDPRFVTTLLSAHAAPSLGDEAKVVAWCRAAAIVAGVDPVTYGLVHRDGANWALAADPAPLEAFVNHLSDHDYVLSVHAMHVVSARLAERYARIRGLAALAPTFAWYRAAILSRTTAIALYDALARRGSTAFDGLIRTTEVLLRPVQG
jgi:hypothetical protein